MADLTLEILTNREKYPDDRKIVLGDGEEVTCKELRDTLQPRAEYTRASQGWASEKQQLTARQQELENAYNATQAQLQQALAEREARGTAPARTASGGYTREELLADPVLGDIVREGDQAKAEIKQLRRELDEGKNYILRREYEARLETLGNRYNSRFNKDGKGKAWDQKAFLDHAINTNTSNLDVAYNSFTLEDEASARAKEAEERGYEKGLKQGKVPNIPIGRRRAPLSEKDLAGKSFQDISEEDIAADPEIQAAMYSDTAG